MRNWAKISATCLTARCHKVANSAKTPCDRSYTARFQVDASKYFGTDDIRNIDATVGIEINSDKYKSFSTVARGYYPDRGETFVSNIDPAVYTGYATLAGEQ